MPPSPLNEERQNSLGVPGKYCAERSLFRACMVCLFLLVFVVNAAHGKRMRFCIVSEIQQGA